MTAFLPWLQWHTCELQMYAWALPLLWHAEVTLQVIVFHTW